MEKQQLYKLLRKRFESNDVWNNVHIVLPLRMRESLRDQWVEWAAERYEHYSRSPEIREWLLK